MRKAIICVLILSMLAACVYAASGTEGDPLISKSYLDEQIAALKAEFEKSAGSGSAAGYKAISVDAGKKLIGKEGTEIILRSGEALAIDNGANGISDVTGAADLMSGTEIKANHLLLTPRDDGRGIEARTQIWLMVRGDYSIE